MKITRNVILDLMPLYLSNEASPDTNALVEEYLQTDPELAEIARQTATSGPPGDTTMPLTKEDKMEAYKEAKRKLMERTIILAAIMAGSVLFVFIMAVIAWFFFKG